MKHDVKECPECGADYLSTNGMSGVQFCQFCGWNNDEQEEYYNEKEGESD